MTRFFGSIAAIGIVASALVCASAALADPSVCVSVNGVERVNKGPVECNSEPGHNVAIAVNGGGEDTGAFVFDGEHNKAIAINTSEAGAAIGDGNTAISVNGSDANASEGDGNVAHAVNDSGAYAEGGDGNHAQAVNESEANAEGGDGNTALAVNGSCAEAGGGDDTDRAINSENC